MAQACGVSRASVDIGSSKSSSGTMAPPSAPRTRPSTTPSALAWSALPAKTPTIMAAPVPTSAKRTMTSRGGRAGRPSSRRRRATRRGR